MGENNQTDNTGGSTTEVKNIMNNVFQMLRSQVTVDESYSGKHVLELSLKVIKTCTLQMLSEKKPHNRDIPQEERKTSEKKVSFSSDVPLVSMGQAEKLNEDQPVESSQEDTDNESNSEIEASENEAVENQQQE